MLLVRAGRVSEKEGNVLLRRMLHLMPLPLLNLNPATSAPYVYIPKAYVSIASTPVPSISIACSPVATILAAFVSIPLSFLPLP